MKDHTILICIHVQIFIVILVRILLQYHHKYLYQYKYSSVGVNTKVNTNRNPALEKIVTRITAVMVGMQMLRTMIEDDLPYSQPEPWF